MESMFHVDLRDLDRDPRRRRGTGTPPIDGVSGRSYSKYWDGKPLLDIHTAQIPLLFLLFPQKIL